MIDLHCHILPGIDDGAVDLRVSLDMARASVADDVSVLACCTPRILPGLCDNALPDLSLWLDASTTSVGVEEADYLVRTRPSGVIGNEIPANLPMPIALLGSARLGGRLC